MRRATAALALAAASFIGSQVYATLTTAGIALVEIPISAAAKAADPALANAHSYDLRVTVPAIDDWSSGDLLATTSGGAQFYNAAAPYGNQPNSALWAFLPAGEFDTFVTGPNFGSVTPLGRFNPPGHPGTEVFGPSETNASWGDTINNSGGTTFVAARITITGATGGFAIVPFNVAGAYLNITGRMGSTGDPLNSPTFSFSLAPEPSSTGLLVLGVAALARRRRK